MGSPEDTSQGGLSIQIARLADAAERQERATTALTKELAALRADNERLYVRKDVYSAEMNRVVDLLEDKAWRSDVTASELRMEKFVTEVTGALKAVADTVKGHSSHLVWIYRTVGAVVVAAIMAGVTFSGGGIRL